MDPFGTQRACDATDLGREPRERLSRRLPALGPIGVAYSDLGNYDDH